MGRKGKEKNCIFGVRRKGKEREGGKKCILVREGNGKDKMSFPSVGRKWEGNIENFWNGREMGRN